MAWSPSNGVTQFSKHDVSLLRKFFHKTNIHSESARRDVSDYTQKKIAQQNKYIV